MGVWVGMYVADGCEKLLGRSRWNFYHLFLTTPGWFWAKKNWKIQKGAREAFFVKKCVFSNNSIIYHPNELKFWLLIPYEPEMVLGKIKIEKNVTILARGLGTEPSVPCIIHWNHDDFETRPETGSKSGFWFSGFQNISRGDQKLFRTVKLFVIAPLVVSNEWFQCPLWFWDQCSDFRLRDPTSGFSDFRWRPKNGFC